MDKLLKAIIGMVSVEEVVKKCPDCAIDAFCPFCYACGTALGCTD